ncbi:MAG: lactate utilization protein C [Gemmatimonadaceae bacterium]
MTAREMILSAVRSARPAPIALPDVDAARATWTPPTLDVLGRFVAAARAAGTDVVLSDRAALAHVVEKLAPTAATRMLSTIPALPGTVPLSADASTLASLELFACEAVIGVAENGAVWIPLSRLGARAAAFLAEHVIIVLARAAVVSDLHEAYARIDVAAEVFGIFVAGPSKTADIEQALVIGAHGPKRLTLVLV